MLLSLFSFSQSVSAVNRKATQQQQSYSGSVLLMLAWVSLPVFAEREFLFAESGSYLSAFERILFLETETVG
jgi:hypothetical protein